MLDVLNAFIVELRHAGIPVSLTEHVDAAHATAAIDLGDRATFKAALRATLVKSEDHRPAFDTAFEVYFAGREALEAEDLAEEGEEADEDSPDGEGSTGLRGAGKSMGKGGGSTMSAEELAQLLERALTTNDAELRARVAKEAVGRYAGMEPGRPVGGTYYLYRTLRNLELDRVAEDLLAKQRAANGDMGTLEERLATDEIGARIDGMKQAIEAGARGYIRKPFTAEQVKERVLPLVRAA